MTVDRWTTEGIERRADLHFRFAGITLGVLLGVLIAKQQWLALLGIVWGVINGAWFMSTAWAKSDELRAIEEVEQ